MKIFLPFCLCALVCLSVAWSYSGENVFATGIVYDVGAAEHRLNRHIYGHFTERSELCIYGGFRADENFGIPSKGRIRLDVVEALKEFAVLNLRWLKRFFANEYHWKHGIEPRENRPNMKNNHWGGVTEDTSKVHHDTTLIPHEKTSKIYAFEGESIEIVRTYCSISEKGMFNATLTNSDSHVGRKLTCRFTDDNSIEGIGGQIVAALKMNSNNDSGKAESIGIQEFSDYALNMTKCMIQMPSRSVALIEL